ncbi:MAG TPA: porin, partial [Rhodocyclaceae bacterium]|nr:porin [Rhodocyclaceae bacterium]
MQKKLIALAVAGLASTGAFAQSNVTVYGVADATYDVVKVSSSTTATNDVGNMNRVSTNSSLIGFKGAEALGNGLTAVFQYEAGVSFDGGSTTALSPSRDSYVGLASGFGTVVAGNLTGPTRALGIAMDVNAGATGIGANSALLGKLGNNLLGTTDANSNYALGNTCGRSSTCASLFDSRWKNAIAYVSPTFAGLNVTAAYVANEGKTNKGTAITGTQVSTQGYDIGAKYANGPILAGLTYNAVSLNNGATAINVGTTQNPVFVPADTSVSDLRAAASYDFGIASIRGLYDQAKAKKFVAAGDVKQSVWGLGGTFNVTPAGKLIGQFYKANQMKVAGASQANTGAKLYELGYEYSLSKRTMLKAVYSTIHN